MQPGPLGGTPASLAGDDFETVPVRAQENRLENAALHDRIGEFVDPIFIELDARLLGVGANPSDLDLANAARA
jgi:hypothetical protein